MSDRTIAGLLMLAVGLVCGWLAYGYVRDGGLSAKGATLTRRERPIRFWTAVFTTASIGLLAVAAGTALLRP